MRMLARITGVLEQVDAGVALIAVAYERGGAAHETLVSPAFAAALAPRVGEVVTLHTIEYFESQTQGASFTPRLLGFASPEDRRFFELLTKVKGLGPRRALRALAEPTAVVAGAIARRDTRALQDLPEIGRKLAETIIAELQEKALAFAGPAGKDPEIRLRPDAARAALDVAAAGASGPALPAEAAQALAALVRLGESRAEAERLVRLALERRPGAGSADEVLTAALASRGV